VQKMEGGLYESTARQIPREICVQLEEMMGVGDIYVMGFTQSGQLFGHVVVITRRQAELTDVETLETFLNQASVALQRRRIELALRESEAKYRSLVESSEQGIFIMTGGRLVFANESLGRLFGQPMDKLLHSDPFAFLTPAWRERMKQIHKQWANGVEVDSVYEIELQRPDGESRIATLHVQNLDYHGHEAIHGVFTDITQQRTLEDQLRQAQKMEAIGTLAGGIAHDFNNLLTGIIGNIGMAAINADSAGRRYLTDAGKAAERAAGLVRQLLTFSRKGRPERELINPGEIVRETADILRETIDRRIAVQQDVAENVWRIVADPGQVHQVAMNLAINARDAIDELMQKSAAQGNGNGQEYQIVLELENVVVDDNYRAIHHDARPGQYVCLSVTDNGAGMDEQTKERIFEPFFTTKEQGKGTGLGLATVFGIAKQHDGWVNVYSEPGEGTTFRVYFPTEDNQEASADSFEIQGEAPGGNETILLVDDEEVIRNLGEAILARKGYNVMLAADGREALDVFAREKDNIDLVILDHTMPFLSGREVLEQIRVLDADVSVLMSSGYSEASKMLQQEAMQAGGFIAKPYRVNELAHKVRQMLDR